MAVFEPGREPVLIPAVGSDEITDVSGAGDTVTAAFALARMAGAGWVEAAWIADCAASRVVTKMGAATCSPDELLEALSETPL
jgi:bifunctional ADP-heptose synthase (sugar kinase/adenylyltransferase)